MLLEHPRARELFPRYLGVTAYVTMEMVPLMEAALHRSRVLEPIDPVAGGLADYLERHIPEEMHGDEPGDGILDDLAALDVDGDALRVGPLPEMLAALFGTLHFRIRHAHPVAILGFLAFEGYPPSPLFVEQLMDKTGLPRDAFRQLVLHAELDPGHGKELDDVIDSLPLESRHEELIGLSALETLAFLVSAWRSVLDDGDLVAATPGP
jgi:hypothetical protein